MCQKYRPEGLLCRQLGDQLLRLRMAEVHAEATECEMKNKCLVAALQPASARKKASEASLAADYWLPCAIRAAWDEAEKKQQLQKDLDERCWSQLINVN